MTLGEIAAMMGLIVFVNGIAHGNFWMMLIPLLCAGAADWWFG